MQQKFNTRNYSVKDFEEWHRRGELNLNPKFQRRDVWTEKARSFLIDTIVRGKPIPKLIMRQSLGSQGSRTLREIVDGQQRLKSVLTFLDDGFAISKVHNKEFGGLKFSALEDEAKLEILKYEFVVDLLYDAPDEEVYDLFARINTYSEKLTAQELRNAKWFGDFRSCVYQLAKQLNPFFQSARVFTPRAILRMKEAEFISELLIAATEGIRDGSKAVIDKAYEKYDDQLPNRSKTEDRIMRTFDTIGNIFGQDLANLKFRAPRLLYPLFCAIYHARFDLPKLGGRQPALKERDYPKIRTALESVDQLLDQQATEIHRPDAIQFVKAYSEHWVHPEERAVMTKFLLRHMETQTRA